MASLVVLLYPILRIYASMISYEDYYKIILPLMNL